jgi:serine kinase of HPr protein (carbohydrate metabolism regulator)
LCGPSGAGKSDLALRLIEAGASLISDDRTLLRRDGEAILASAPESISGMIEVRGLGLVHLPCLSEARLSAVIDLVSEAEMERLPLPETSEFMGITLPLYRLSGLAASSVAKVRLIAGSFAHCEVIAV